MRLLCALLPLLACSPPPSGDPAQAPPARPVPAVLTLLTPPSVFAGRTASLQLSGDGTHFGPETMVRFADPALRVTQVTVRDSGNLQAEVEVGEQAPLAAHDLTVTTRGAGPGGAEEQAALKDALRVRAALAAAPGKGAAAPQGGVVDFDLRNLDLEHPLSGGTRLIGGARPLFVTALNNRLSGYGLADALGEGGLILVAQADAGLRYTLDPQDPGAPRLSARAPAGLVPGQVRSGESFAAPRQSNLYKLTTSADGQVLVLTAAVGAMLAPRTLAGALAPQSGRFTEGQFLYASANGATQTLLGRLPVKGDHYVALVPSHLGGGAGHDYSLTAKVATGRSFSTREDPLRPDGPAAPIAALTMDGPHYSSDGAFGADGDADYVRVSVPRSGRLYVQVVTPSLHFSRASAAAAVLQADCMTPLAPLRTAQQEAAVTAGATYCVQLASLNGAVEPYQAILAQDP